MSWFSWEFGKRPMSGAPERAEEFVAKCEAEGLRGHVLSDEAGADLVSALSDGAPVDDMVAIVRRERLRQILEKREAFNARHRHAEWRRLRRHATA